MPDTDQPEEETTPAAAPVEPASLDLGKLEALLDKRFSGFQSSIDKRFEAFVTGIDEQLKTANLTPEEQEQHEFSKAQERNKKLEQENALLRLGRQFPEEVAFLEEFYGKDSLEAQIATLAMFRKQKVEETVEEPASEPTPVNPNNPARGPRTSIAETGGEMTAELADEILHAVDEPGALVRLRKAVGI